MSLNFKELLYNYLEQNNLLEEVNSNLLEKFRFIREEFNSEARRVDDCDVCKGKFEKITYFFNKNLKNELVYCTGYDGINDLIEFWVRTPHKIIDLKEYIYENDFICEEILKHYSLTYQDLLKQNQLIESKKELDALNKEIEEIEEIIYHYKLKQKLNELKLRRDNLLNSLNSNNDATILKKKK